MSFYRLTLNPYTIQFEKNQSKTNVCLPKAQYKWMKGQMLLEKKTQQDWTENGQTVPISVEV